MSHDHVFLRNQEVGMSRFPLGKKGTSGSSRRSGNIPTSQPGNSSFDEINPFDIETKSDTHSEFCLQTRVLFLPGGKPSPLFKRQIICWIKTSCQSFPEYFSGIISIPNGNFPPGQFPMSPPQPHSVHAAEFNPRIQNNLPGGIEITGWASDGS